MRHKHSKCLTIELGKDREFRMNTKQLHHVLTRKLDNASWPRVLWVLCVAFVGGWLVWRSPDFLKRSECGVFDLLQRYDRAPEPKVPFILITAGTRSGREASEGSWPRSMHARLLRRLGESRLVLLDMLFSERTRYDEDEALVQAVREHGRVLGNSYLAPLFQEYVVQEPFPEIRHAFRRVGIANLQEEPDGVYRKGIWGLESQSDFIPSLALVALEELQSKSFAHRKAGEAFEVILPWKRLPLQWAGQGFVDFWVNRPKTPFPVYEYIDVLEGKVPADVFKDAFVVVGFDNDGAGKGIRIPGNRFVSHAEYIANTVASLLGSFAPHPVAPLRAAVLTALLVMAAATIGFFNFRKSFLFLLLLLTFWAVCVFILFLKWGIWLPLIGVFWAAICGYLGSQLLLIWRLYNDWNVRTLSIKPLLSLAQKADIDFDKEVNFDDYLRSLWSEIEEKTGVELKSARIQEDFSLVRNYLAHAKKTPQQGQDNFIIIRNASPVPPYHRMLLPLPFWSEESKTKPREYAVLAWDGKVPLETLTSLAAMTLFAAVHFHALEESRRRKEMLFKTMEAIMMAVEAKDPLTSQHSRRVANLSRKLAQWMKLSPQEVEDVYFSAIIHDIGKLGISDSVLKKPGMLTDEEFAEMQRHPLIGRDIMKPVELPEFVVSGIMQHHERYDGKGYPSKLTGDNVTLAGKIIKVADVFDALISRRQYKDPWTEEQVRSFMLERRGTEFDPRVVDVFLRHLPEESRNPLLFYGTLF